MGVIIVSYYATMRYLILIHLILIVLNIVPQILQFACAFNLQPGPTNSLFATASMILMQSSGGFGGGSGGSLEPPSGTKLFHFHGEFYEKLGKMLKTNPLLMDLNPLPEILDPPLQSSLLFKVYASVLE